MSYLGVDRNLRYLHDAQLFDIESLAVLFRENIPFSWCRENGIFYNFKLLL
jgi:hypothetical protein